MSAEASLLLRRKPVAPWSSQCFATGRLVCERLGEVNAQTRWWTHCTPGPTGQLPCAEAVLAAQIPHFCQVLLRWLTSCLLWPRLSRCAVPSSRPAMPTIPRLACTANAVASPAIALRHRSCTETAGILGLAASAESCQAIPRPLRFECCRNGMCDGVRG